MENIPGTSEEMAQMCGCRGAGGRPRKMPETVSGMLRSRPGAQGRRHSEAALLRGTPSGRRFQNVNPPSPPPTPSPFPSPFPPTPSPPSPQCAGAVRPRVRAQGPASPELAPGAERTDVLTCSPASPAISPRLAGP